MKRTLYELPTKALFEKIGAGNHKPGSGSAAALKGILSCKLILTVIQLTLEPKRKAKYDHTYSKCKDIQFQITGRIEPELEKLFQEDSEQFDRAIKKRKERDNAQIQSEKNRLDRESLKELRVSTELPIEIANLSLELAKFALYLIDNCFKSARGDSSVAFSSALASISGCISIINLNLQSFPKNNWTQKIKKRRKKLKEEFIRLTEENNQRIDSLEEEADRKNELNAEVLQLKKRHYGQDNISDSELEKLARDVQLLLWNYKDIVWRGNPPSNIIGLIKPKKVIRLLKYAYKEVDTLGVTEFNEEIGGLINNYREEIIISKMYTPEERSFTSAHELGHAFLHDKIELHRDKPLNNHGSKQRRKKTEIEADKFAAFFLMPEKQVKQIFFQLFGLNKFIINEQTVFALTNSNIRNFRNEVKTKRDLSRKIAKSNFFNFKPFMPLNKIFNVSIEAMAIRLEELNIVEWRTADNM